MLGDCGKDWTWYPLRAATRKMSIGFMSSCDSIVGLHHVSGSGHAPDS